jgi:hypothetical protein
VRPTVHPPARPPARPPTANRSRKSLTLSCRSNTQETERFFLGFKEQRDVETERQTSRDEQKIHPFQMFRIHSVVSKTKEISFTHFSGSIELLGFDGSFRVCRIDRRSRLSPLWRVFLL